MPDAATIAASPLSQRARAHFREGLNCAECVFLAFLETQESTLPPEVLRLASGFGGGIGQTKHLCGAISGALLGLGCLHGRDPYEKEAPRERGAQLRAEVYPHFAAYLNEVEVHYGCVDCAKLTATHPDFDAPARRQSCAEIVAYCAALLEEHAARG